jgi:hypothetical protein
MKRLEIILAAALAFLTSGCAIPGKPRVVAAAPAPNPTPPPPTPPSAPPAPLSIPQTNVELPAPQPISAEALATTRVQEEQSLPVASPPPRPSRRGSQGATAAPKPETTSAPAVAPPPPVTTTPSATTTTTTTEGDRPLIRALESPAEMNRLQHTAEASRREVQQLLKQAQGRIDAALLTQIQSFLRQSEDAQQRGEMRTASEIADKALGLARGLPGGR